MKVSASKDASSKGSCSALALRGARFARRDRRRRRALARGQHLGALVDADDAAAVAADELDRRPRAVPQATSRTCRLGPASIRSTRNARQRGSWPKREQPRVAVVGLAERREERLGRAVALAEALRSRGYCCALWGSRRRLRAAAEAASAHAADGEELEGVVPAEPGRGRARLPLRLPERAKSRPGSRSTPRYRPVADRALVREAVSIAAHVSSSPRRAPAAGPRRAPRAARRAAPDRRSRRASRRPRSRRPSSRRRSGRPRARERRLPRRASGSRRRGSSRRSGRSAARRSPRR